MVQVVVLHWALAQVPPPQMDPWATPQTAAAVTNSPLMGLTNAVYAHLASCVRCADIAMTPATTS